MKCKAADVARIVACLLVIIVGHWPGHKADRAPSLAPRPKAVQCPTPLMLNTLPTPHRFVMPDPDGPDGPGREWVEFNTREA